MTPERLDEIRALVAGHNPVMGLRHIATDLLAALDAERAALDETRRERDEALADATKWRDEQAEIDADLSDADDWIAENAKIRALPEAERAAAVEDARARGVFDGEGREPADYTDLMRSAATMPGFVRACMKLREASERAEKAERERDEARAALVELAAATRHYLAAPEPPYEYPGGCFGDCAGKPRGCCADCERRSAAYGLLDDALDLAPAALAGQQRARVLREAADSPARFGGMALGDNAREWLRALADEAER